MDSPAENGGKKSEVMDTSENTVEDNTKNKLFTYLKNEWNKDQIPDGNITSFLKIRSVSK